MSDIPQSLRDLAAAERELEQYHRDMAEVQTRFDGIRARRDAAIDARLAEITDEQIMEDEVIRLWLLNLDGSMNAYYRVRGLAEFTISEVRVHGSDGRDGHRNLLRPIVILERDSDIAVVTAELALWVTTWGMGRTDIPIDVLDSSLSSAGSWAISWNPYTTHAELLEGRHSDPEFTGTLYDVLAYTAQHHPYNHGVDERDDY